MLITNWDSQQSCVPSLLVLKQLKDNLKSLMEVPTLLMTTEITACTCDQGSAASQHSTILLFLWVTSAEPSLSKRTAGGCGLPREAMVPAISVWYVGIKPKRARCRQTQQEGGSGQWTFAPICPQHGSLLPKGQSPGQLLLLYWRTKCEQRWQKR